MAMRILICDDDREIADAIEIYLKSAGYETVKAYDGVEALAAIEDGELQLIIMDVMMPRLDGIAATLKIREQRNIPIIMLSAKTEDSDKILGLQMGADDYVAKPFNPLELLARVNSQLRRYTELGCGEIKSGTYRSGGLVIDDATKMVTVDGEEVKLTPMQYKILLLLLKNKGRVFSIDQIYEAVWNEDSFNAENIIAVHVRNIREKIEINPKDPKYLKVVWGIGYKIEAL
jgi:DNA-binding response OmpR family regulator